MGSPKGGPRKSDATGKVCPAQGVPQSPSDHSLLLLFLHLLVSSQTVVPGGSRVSRLWPPGGNAASGVRPRKAQPVFPETSLVVSGSVPLDSVSLWNSNEVPDGALPHCFVKSKYAGQNEVLLEDGVALSVDRARKAVPDRDAKPG